jgi:hypothetical protein
MADSRLGRNLDVEIEGNSMNVTLLKALVALVPACILFSGSVILFSRGTDVRSFLQLLGAMAGFGMSF